MSIKDLFGKRSNKVVGKAQIDKLADEVESFDLISANADKNNKLTPRVDYTSAEKFAHYGSAEKYYEDSINHILKSYPYDGSEAEKMAWRNEASGLDEHILDTDYPKAVGHILLNSTADAVDSTYSEAGTGTFYRYDAPQWISIKGGPNKDPSAKEGDKHELSKQFPPKGGRANIWDDNLFRESNLGINPSYGNTVEFWAKFTDDAWITGGQAGTLFDLWNGVSHGSAGYVRLMIEVLPTTGNDFSVTYKYGNGSEGAVRAAVNLTTATKTSLGANWRKNWNHYSFAISSSSAGITVELYINGVYESKVTSGNEITSTVPQEGYIANINALRTKPLSTSPTALSNSDGGIPGLNLDEFRFWKKTRNAKQIGRYWFTGAFGGTNTDDTKYHKETGGIVDLGVYYKFNEGIFDATKANDVDSQCLDYSGRISNGTIHNYSTAVRLTTSAMDTSTVVQALGVIEEKDPIMYATHSDVVTLKTNLMLSGSMWDMENNSSFYHTMPQWILEEDDNGHVIKTLAQTLSSYFDHLHGQISMLGEIRDAKYFDLSDSQQKPVFFAKQLLRSVGFDVVDLFSEASIMEEIVSRGEQDVYDARIQDVKNVIYQNIYNSMSYIYKSKGTEKSFRNLIRCFGVDDEIIKLNLYADGVDYTLDGRRSYSSIKKNYIDFNNIDRIDGTVFSKDSGTSDEQGWITAPTTPQSKLLSTTLTAEVIFPIQLPKEAPNYSGKSFTTISLFGCKKANLAGGPPPTAPLNGAGTDNVGRLQVQAIMGIDETGSSSRDLTSAKFKLIYTDSDGDHELITDEYKDVWENSKWNFAVRIFPDAPLGDYVTGSDAVNYKIEFYGVQMTMDVLQNEFTKTATYTGSNISKARGMIAQPKIVYAGMYRDNLLLNSGSLFSDVKVTDIMFWFDKLEDEEIKTHATDVTNTGRLFPNDDAYAFFSELSSGGNADSAKPDFRVPKKDTLALHWNFANVLKSNASGEFIVDDTSLGGADYIAEARYGWFTNLVGYRHTGLASFDAASCANDTEVINREYQYTAKHRLPEVLAGDDMIEIRTQDDNTFTKDSRPINHFFAIEKSMYQVISDEMLSMFATVVEFNDLIGQPVHRYRMEYKSLQKFRGLFFERVDNVPSFEKFVAFYKWLDSSVGLMLQQLIPASGNFSESMRNMVENHLLERSKYWTKFPTLEMKQDPPEATLRGIRELTYDWEHGHAPADRYNKKSISLDGSNDHILLTDDNAFSFTDGSDDAPFSISAWVYVGDISTDNGPFVTKVNFAAANSSEYLFKHENGVLRLHIYDSALSASGQQLQATASAPSLTSKKWHHVVATYDGSEAHAGMKMYTDGVLTASTSLEQGTYENMRNTTAALAFGATIDGATPPLNNNRVFEDKLADIALFDKALTADEVKELYNSGEVYDIRLHSASSNIISWYKMGDGEDAIGVGGIKDYVGTRHGTLTNGAAIVDEAELPSVLDYDESEHCLWRAERAERGVVDATEDDNVDKDRESIRKAKVRDVLGQNKMVKTSTGGFVEQGDPTLYDIATSKQYEGSTYATRRLSRPYKLSVQESKTVAGGPNFANATPASPNEMLRTATNYGTKIGLTRLADDPDSCQDEYSIKGGPETEKRRAHVVRLTDAASVVTELKGSLFTPPFYGAYPNDSAATQRNITHDSYGQDHEIPMQGVFAAQWVGGNQHRHIDLNKGTLGAHDAIATRPELYLDNGADLVHPHTVNKDHPAARYTRDGTAKRPFNIANVNTGINKDNYTSYDGTPRLGNYTRDYEVVQTSGRTQNNRWHVRNPAYTPDNIASTYVSGLRDFTLPDRTKDSAGGDFGRTEHVFVERFSAPGGPSTLSRGALDIQAEEFSVYNSLNYRNLRVRHHLNFWHKEHTAQFGYREDYIHGTPLDFIDINSNTSEDAGEANDFGGNTAGVGAWHKNNRNPLTRMHLQAGSVQEPFCSPNAKLPTQAECGTCSDSSYTNQADCEGNGETWTPQTWVIPSATFESRRRYDNFYISHQIPQSDWQYHWITSSAVHFNDIVEYDDEHRSAVTETTFPFDHDGSGDTGTLITHPRLSGYISEYDNVSIGVSGSMDHVAVAGSGTTTTAGLLLSGSAAIKHRKDGVISTKNLEIDFVYGNYVVAEPVSFFLNTVGGCYDCTPIRMGDDAENGTRIAKQAAYLNALLLNRNGPYQGAGWKMLRNSDNPLVRQQRRRNIISIQDVPDSNRLYENRRTATKGHLALVVNSIPANNFAITSSLFPGTITIDVSKITAGNSPELADKIKSDLTTYFRKQDRKLPPAFAVSSAQSSHVRILSSTVGKMANEDYITFTFNASDITVDGDNNITTASPIQFEKFGFQTNGGLIKTEVGGITIDTAGSNKVVKVNLQGGHDAEVRSWYYNDTRSDSHKKYLEPPAAWNMPMYHYVVEKQDNSGILATHSYSNNLKTFANPKLSFRTNVHTKETEQTYDVLLNKYLPSQSEQLLDFVGLRYKEYIFPKHRNVGLLKIRGRTKWDDLTQVQKELMSTGALRIFWKDDVFARTKGSKENTVNALGYKAAKVQSYLLATEDGTSLDNWGQLKSIFSMDNVVFDKPSDNNPDTTSEFRQIGDLQYVGWETYMSWIVNRSCTFDPNSDFVNYEVIDIDDISAHQDTTVIPSLGDLSALVPDFENFGDPTARRLGARIFDTGVELTGGGRQDNTELSFNVGAVSRVFNAAYEATGHSNEQVRAKGSARLDEVSNAFQQLIDIAINDPVAKHIATTVFIDGDEHSSYAAQAFGECETIKTRTGLQRVCEEPTIVERTFEFDFGDSLSPGKSPQTPQQPKTEPVTVVNTATRTNISPRCTAPEVVAQLYYNPYGDLYKEGAWLYRTNVIREKNPWYDRYKDFSIETRCMAQNYGVLAEFRISEHMSKHLQQDAGDFRAKNYNFLTLHGASYKTISPYGAVDETAYSGKITYPTKQVFTVDGSMDKLVTGYPHAKDIFSGWSGLTATNDRTTANDAQQYFRNRIRTMNNAFSYTTGRGTLSSSAPYTDYAFQSPIFAGGNLTLSNNVIDVYQDGDYLESGQVRTTAPWTNRVSWGDGQADDGTGRHRWFSSEETLYAVDDTGIIQVGTEQADETYKTLHYREANSFSAWNPVLPYGNDENVSGTGIAALSINTLGRTNEYLYGQIGHWDELVDSGGNIAKISGIRPFEAIKETNSSDEPVKKQMYNGATNFNSGRGTPVTISLWAKPESNVIGCAEREEYDNNPVGLFVFGNYEFVDSQPKAAFMKKADDWRTQIPDGDNIKSLDSVDTTFGMFANFPAPYALKDSAAYKDGMGLTFFIADRRDRARTEEIGYRGRESTKESSAENFDNDNVYHFFRKHPKTDKYYPAVLPKDKWSNVTLQILPGISGDDTQNARIKVLLTSKDTQSENQRGATYDGFEEVLYGIHRSALTSTGYQKKAYSVVPIGKDHHSMTGSPPEAEKLVNCPWGIQPSGFAAGRGYGGSGFSSVISRDYKLGKAVFNDIEDDSARENPIVRQPEEYWYFKGAIMEFSMWAGILSRADTDYIRRAPQNILEGYLNGEVLGGYTASATANEQWGSTAPTIVLPNDNQGLVVAHSDNAITFTNRVFEVSSKLSLESSRSSCKLCIWHRLGIRSTLNILEKCEDWDDEFFNNYVHTDPIQFFDAIVEDHDTVSDTVKKRIRFKVNALKKLIPYRGFYPQDRTLQLAKLFSDKMSESIRGADESVLTQNQAMQAAMQPFFAPGILYNSIKAGIAVDWPVFTNETGLEPTYPNSQCTLPYYNEDVHGLTDAEAQKANLAANGQEVRLSSIAPDWYNPRLETTSAVEGLLLEYEKYTSEGDVSDDQVEIQQQNQIRKLYESQPKFFEKYKGGDTTAAQSSNGYVIRKVPNMRIPFEGLVSLDSVLPKASDTYESIETAVQDRSFKHIDLEISGWDTEGVEISISQPVAHKGAKRTASSYPVGEQWTNNFKMQTVSITIGDPEREMGSEDWDVGVNFRRVPKGWQTPAYRKEKAGSSDGEIVAYEQDQPEITIDQLNEEIAVKLCRHINTRQDIHFVAVAGYTKNFTWSALFNCPDDPRFTALRLNDDHVARVFPAVYPEIFDISKDSIAPQVVADVNEAAHVQNLWSRGADIWKKNRRAAPEVGNQNNGTWRVRLVYVGPPKIKLDMNAVDLSHTEMSTSVNRYNIDGTAGDVITELGMRPYDGILVKGIPPTSMQPYDSSNPDHYDAFGESNGAYINSLMNVEGTLDEDGTLRTEPGRGINDSFLWGASELEEISYKISDDGLSPLETGEHLNSNRGLAPNIGWKQLHLVCPFGEAGSYDEDTGAVNHFHAILGSSKKLPISWIRTGGVEPTSFFSGGGWLALEKEDFVLGDICSISITRHLGTLALSKWVDGWGWKGSAKYSIDTELGVRVVSEKGVTIKGNVNDTERTDTVFGRIRKKGLQNLFDLNRGFLNSEAAITRDKSLGVDNVVGGNTQAFSNGAAVVEMEESRKPQQGPFGLYGGYSVDEIEQVRVTPKPHQIYLMTPEYYVGHKNESGGGATGKNWAANWRNYCYPYFEYLGNNGDNRFEMAMHNFLAEVPNFFLKDSKLISFSSQPESKFKVMQAGKTYYMNVSMYQSERFCTVASPYSDVNALGRPNQVAFGKIGTSRLTMEGRYYGPAFQWKSLDDYKYEESSASMEKQMVRDPAQAPYVPPYLYGKQTARILFTPGQTRKHTLEEIFAGAEIQNVSAECWEKFKRSAQEDNGTIYYNSDGILNSPAYQAKTTISASMNLFGKSTIKQVQYSAQLSRLRDDLDESLQRFVPQTATDPDSSQNDVWVIGTKWECPILNFYNQPSLNSLSRPSMPSYDDVRPSLIPSALSGNLRVASSKYGYTVKDSSAEGLNSGTGIWASYGTVPSSSQGVFVTIEESTTSSLASKVSDNYGSLIDVCGFTTQKQKVGEIAENKEISEAVVMIPFVDKPSDTAAETVVVDDRHFFKIDKDVFNLQKSNIEAGKPAISAGEYQGVVQDIEQTSISQMIKRMKKYNVPPRYDFVRYPLQASEHPFVMYIFEFNHKLDKQDLADIWQGLPPKISTVAEHDSSLILHDMSPVDFFEENTLPRDVRWMVFKIKKKAKESYYEATASGTDDSRFQFNFELGKMPPKYSYNWPYDHFTMLEMVQVEAGLDMYEDRKVVRPTVTSTQGETSSREAQRQTQAVQQTPQQGVVSPSPITYTIGTGEDR